MSTIAPSGTLLLDYIRYHRYLTGTKIGCREGDCGACTVLVGECTGESVQYRSVTSCLTAIGNVQGKHVVTIEGVNFPSALNPIQQAMLDESATQCGFCTPGFVVSLAGFCLSEKAPTYQNALACVDGNICRCTGYKSIEKAVAKVAAMMLDKKDTPAIDFVTLNRILPEYFSGMAEKLNAMNAGITADKVMVKPRGLLGKYLGGGSDLYVQQHETMEAEVIDHLFNDPALKIIERVDDTLYFGAAVTITDLQESVLMQQYIPEFDRMLRLVSSTPIRNMATIAGNFINASPIGDFTIFFLALDAWVILSNGENTRELPLRKLYKGYKALDKTPDEFVWKIYFRLPAAGTLFNFEKVSKRTHLDIASVNTALCLTMNNGIVAEGALSAGGIGPVPAYLSNTSAIFSGRVVDASLVAEIIAAAQLEASPISDARGTATYKRLLLQQLIKAHFITLFPDMELV